MGPSKRTLKMPKNVNGAEHVSGLFKVIQGGIFILGIAYRRAGNVTGGE